MVLKSQQIHTAVLFTTYSYYIGKGVMLTSTSSMTRSTSLLNAKENIIGLEKKSLVVLLPCIQLLSSTRELKNFRIAQGCDEILLSLLCNYPFMFLY